MQTRVEVAENIGALQQNNAEMQQNFIAIIKYFKHKFV